MIRLYVGFDPREAAVFHVFNQSVIENASKPVSIIPLAENLLHFDGQQDGSNAFIYSRYLVPSLQNFEGWAIFCDGDMVVTEDVTQLWKLRDETKAAQVVMHNYKTGYGRKYVGTPLESPNLDYPRKNWSSVILWNCGHPSNKVLTRDYVADAGGACLHRFQWLNDDEIGALPAEWNGLVEEQDTTNSKLLHFTLGVPGFKHYMRCNDHRVWNKYLLSALRLEGERPDEIVRRASWRN